VINFGMLGLVVGVVAVLTVPLLIVRLARAERATLDRLRQIGATHRAVIKNLQGHGTNFCVVLQVPTPQGPIGRSFNVGNRAQRFPPHFFADRLATGEPVEVLYHPEVAAILLRNDATGNFE
jgi:hypothetical protein